ncbi:hypothetical protein QYS60_09305 [Rhodococcus sp. GXMU-t2271]|uniref:Uncharacterized protein n=1 Tax=Rhodococcus indonesiensis TaxID=3055869 RepID=A0ABT7RPE1_9NOCA|nr:hypothetical protein [Rhodococcus indonesiensis]MDM7489516.1 hypothetical protein [Rhodococcus indonesiensis]
MTLVVENPHVVISRFQTVVQALSDNVYLQEVLSRRTVEVVHVAGLREIQRSGRVLFDEPPAVVLIGPEAPGSFAYDGTEHTFTLTVKRAKGVELTMSGDERTIGLRSTTAGPATRSTSPWRSTPSACPATTG